MSPDAPLPQPAPLGGTYQPAAPPSGTHRPVNPDTGEPVERRQHEGGTAVAKALSGTMPKVVEAAASGAASGMMGFKGLGFQIANTSALVLFGVVFLWQFRMQADQQRDDRQYYRDQIRQTQVEADHREQVIRDADTARNAALVSELRGMGSRMEAVAAEMRAVRISIERSEAAITRGLPPHKE